MRVRISFLRDDQRLGGNAAPKSKPQYTITRAANNAATTTAAIRSVRGVAALAKLSRKLRVNGTTASAPEHRVQRYISQNLEPHHCSAISCHAETTTSLLITRWGRWPARPTDPTTSSARQLDPQ